MLEGIKEGTYGANCEGIGQKLCSKWEKIYYGTNYELYKKELGGTIVSSIDSIPVSTSVSLNIVFLPSFFCFTGH